MRPFILFLCFVISKAGIAQELFVYSEPASNMPANTVGVRITTKVLQKENYKYFISASPEIMLGISKKWMLHVAGFLDDDVHTFKPVGGSLYAKYRFYSNDDIHSHFRLAGFSRFSFNNSKLSSASINLEGKNSGVDAGFIATKLIHKTAVSATGSFIHAITNGNQQTLLGRNSIGYIFSAGKLLLPADYVNYNQTNLNVMIEFPGQTSLANGHTILNCAPSLQLIFISRVRVDAGYSFPIIKSLENNIRQGFLVRLEYVFFNALK